MSSRDLFELEPGDTGEAIRLPGPPVHIVHNHDLDPTCRETRNQLGKLVGECLTTVAHADRDGSEEPPPVEAALAPLAEADKVNDRGAQAAPDCGGCAGQGAHKRACAVAVGPDAARYHRWADQLNNIGDSVGPNEMRASSLIWAAAAALRKKARVEGELYAGRRP